MKALVAMNFYFTQLYLGDTKRFQSARTLTA
jgi:hypothetical protein